MTSRPAAAGTALTKRKSEKVGRKRRAAEGAGQDVRRVEVQRLLMERKSYREIVEALNELPEERRPASVSVATVTRDVQALRAEWAADRKRGMEELVGEEVARLNELEKVWWPIALTGDRPATEMVLAIQRQRLHVLGIGGNRGAVQITAGAAAQAGGVNTEGPLPANAKVQVVVEYVDDRRDLGR